MSKVKATSDVKNYDLKHQQYILNQVMNSPELYSRCSNILRGEYFDPIFRMGLSKVHDHVTQYNELPSIDHISAVYGMEVHNTEVDNRHHDALLDVIEEFCKHKAMENAIINSAPLLQEKKYGAVAELIKEAMYVSLQKDLGLNVYEDPTQVIESLAAMQGTFKSGWDTLDFKLNGGFGRKELEIFAAASGGGKSVVLQNLAVNFTQRGVKGAYITLELAEELVANRIYGMMLESSSSSIRNNITTTHSKIKILEKSGGGLHVKRLPESITTVNDIETYLLELKMRTGNTLDYVCVDYLDLMTSDRVSASDGVFTKDKFVSEELRAMANRLDITVFTACQFNRSGVDADQKSQSQISGGISKIFTADNVIYIDAHKDRGEMIFDFQKTRNSGAVGSRLRMAYNADCLRVDDHEDVVLEYETLFSEFRKTRNAKAVQSNVVSSPSVSVQLPQQTQNASQSLKDKLSTRLNPLKPKEPEVLASTEPDVAVDEYMDDDVPWDTGSDSTPPTSPSVPESSSTESEAQKNIDDVEQNINTPSTDAINTNAQKTASMRAFLNSSRKR